MTLIFPKLIFTLVLSLIPEGFFFFIFYFGVEVIKLLQNLYENERTKNA